MKNIVWFVQLVLLSAVIFVSSNASAETPCAPDENGNCIKIVVTPGEEGVGGGGGLVGGGLIGCGGCGGGGGNGAAQDTAQKITDAIKKSKDLCKKASEDCGSWGSRMTAPQPAGSGFCTNISAALPLIGTSICIHTVNTEVNLNGCANVRSGSANLHNTLSGNSWHHVGSIWVRRQGVFDEVNEEDHRRQTATPQAHR